jgi:phage terminase Nu1 subunit (DNA packaging protein)
MMLAVDGDKVAVTLLDEVDEQEEARLAEAKMVAEQTKARKKTAVLVTVVDFIIGLVGGKDAKTHRPINLTRERL